MTLRSKPPRNPNNNMTIKNFTELFRADIFGVKIKSLLTTEQMFLQTKKSNFSTSSLFLSNLQCVWYLFPKFLKFSLYLNSGDLDFDIISGAFANFHPSGKLISNVAMPSGDSLSSLMEMSSDFKEYVKKFIKKVKTKTKKTRKKYFILVKN